MKHSSSVVTAFLLVVVAAQPARPVPTVTACDLSGCPPAECADPVYSPDSCCPSCESSNCRFRGCVHFGAFGPRWLPDSCTICSCLNGEERCTHIECTVPQCFGYPTKVKKGECCPVCDFGIPEDECAPVPVSRKAMYVALGDESCLDEVTMHGCDKDFLLRDGIIMKCVPSEKLMAHRFTQRECPVRKVTYKDVKGCEAKRASAAEIPEDLDLTPSECQLYFNPSENAN